MYKSETSVHAVVTIILDHELLESARLALEPEAKTPSSDRSSTVIEVSDNQLVLTTDANDVSALRANLNSYLRWVEGIQGIVDNLESFS
jgi:tRNA threonylcarbamoyladenosine modification (KEOPS) complex  Pcc1 subunit